MGKYDLLKDFDTSDIGITVSPHWILAFIRFNELVTYRRSATAELRQNESDANLAPDRAQKDRNRSYSDDDSDAVRENLPLIIHGDVLSLNTNTSKQSHISSLSATLAKGSIEYLGQIFPGDWVMAWMVNNETQALGLIQRLKKSYACNYFDDGLKFIGRVDSIHKNSSVDRNIGTRSTKYTVTASGFGEFDSKIFYDAKLSRGDDFGKQFERLGVAIETVTLGTNNQTNSPNSGALDINKIFPFFVTLLLGREGLLQKLNAPQSQDNDALRAIPNSSYLIPTTVATLLGVETVVNETLGYSDLVEVLFGVHHYRETGVAHENDIGVFKTDNVQVVGNMLKTTGIPLSGEFIGVIPTFNYTPVWEILKQFSNPALNEMYTCLRVNDEGRILPQLILRQLPFTTDFNSFGSGISFTELTPPQGLQDPTTFKELPRWKLSPQMVWDVNIARSNAQRFNWVQVCGIAPGSDPNDTANVMINNIALRDDEDEKRSGLRPYSLTVPVSRKEAVSQDLGWTDFVADFLMGQHLTLCGTITTIGIQSPICEGDNLEYDGVIYHIEGVSHNCMMQGNNRFWETTLMVTHGIATEEKFNAALNGGARRDEAYYAMLGFDNNSGTNDTGATVDNKVKLQDSVGLSESIIIENNSGLKVE